MTQTNIDWSTADESALQKAECPTPKSITELMEFIETLANREQTYDTCVYAMSLAATATFNFIADKLGCTNFQASCADLDFIRRVRNIDGPFALIKAHKMLYPQYDIIEDIYELLEKWKPWAAEKAKAKLSESKNFAAPQVVEHWEKLANSENTTT